MSNHSGYANEHGQDGMHRAYGIRMVYRYMKNVTEFNFDNRTQKATSWMRKFAPMVQIIDDSGYVQDCQVQHQCVSGTCSPYENAVNLFFDPAFTGWVISLARVFNVVLSDPDGTGGASSGTSETVDHCLAAPAFCNVLDDEHIEVGAQVQLMSDDQLEINLASNPGYYYSIHGLANPMCRKYKLDLDVSYKQNIYHYLGSSGVIRPPYVMIVDDSGYVVEAQIKHLNMNAIELEFSTDVDGYVYLLMG